MTTPAKPVKAAQPVKAVTKPAPVTKFPDVPNDGLDPEEADLLGGDDDDTQMRIDSSITRELEEVGYEIAGVRLRPLSMSAVMRLHQVGNEIMAGKQVKDMDNPVYAAAEFLYSLALENPLEDVVVAAYGPREHWRMLVSLWAETVAPSDTLVSDVINHINDATSTRVKARLPKHLEGSTSEGNGSLHRGR